MAASAGATRKKKAHRRRVRFQFGHVSGRSVMPAASLKRVSPPNFFPVIAYRFFVPLPKFVFCSLKCTVMVLQMHHHNAFAYAGRGFLYTFTKYISAINHACNT
jgi:hypothetical protein